MRTADAASPVSGSTGPPGGRDARHALRLARIVRLALWAAVILLLAGGGLAYSCMPAEMASPGPLAGSLWCGR
jgi:hypothetical protein